MAFLGRTCRSTLTAIAAVLLRATEPGAAVHADAGPAYDGPDDPKRQRFPVEHERKAWARDDDGDGVREGRSDTIEGLRLGLRNGFRAFRGGSKSRQIGRAHV
mgnify:FL=1